MIVVSFVFGAWFLFKGVPACWRRRQRDAPEDRREDDMNAEYLLA
jgi:hypothetical protein